MKKLAISMLSLTLFFFIGATAFSLTTNDPTSVQKTTSPGITYVVMVHAPSTMDICHSYYVIISDQNGNHVATPKVYNQGITNYIFHEQGPVSGGRVATLEIIDTGDNHVCGQKIYTAPDAKFQKFRNSVNYIFNLYPVIIPGDD